MWEGVLLFLVQIFDTFLTFLDFPREDAGGLSREYVLRIPNVS